jgi:hypothetical protein
MPLNHASGFLRGRRLAGAVAHHLDAYQQATAPHVADQLMLGGQSAQAVNHLRARVQRSPAAGPP